MDEKKSFIDEEYDYSRKKRTNQKFRQSVRINHGPIPSNDEDASTESVKSDGKGSLPRSIFLNDEKQEGDPDYCSGNK
ncbi:hypothetical protein [Salinicoccus roseus]|uniref:hypothetical protein n=1 Tax=Salinicoccus roseus TaxID=45670 RepID=UPI0023012CC2|nr:hypothetical protein [Salinicoccus roseus]